MTFESISKIVKDLKDGQTKNIVDERLHEFEEIGKKGNDELFQELCYCFLTANFSAQGAMKIQETIRGGFIHLPQSELAQKLKELGHRHPNKRSEYIYNARINYPIIKETLNSLNDEEARKWVDEIKGIGMKEASHFLRNIGRKNLSIIDYHIVDILVNHGLLETPKSKSLTPKKYLEIEDILKKIARITNTNLAELDLYLWYMETGKILK